MVKKSSKSAKKSKSQTKRRQPAAPAAPVWRYLCQIALLLAVTIAVWAIYLDAQVRARFDGHKWTLPAKVYARPLLLHPGQFLSVEQLQAELSWGDYRPDVGLRQPGTYRVDGQYVSIYRRAFAFWDGREGSRILQLQLAHGRVQSVSENGQALALARLEPLYIGGIFPAHNEDRELIRLDDVPPVLVAALVATEDKHYFTHFGISPRGIARAMFTNIRQGGVVQGGSTLTQQLVKNFFLTSERSFSRKANEAMMALLLELHYSKEEILQAYLNEVYLGQAGRRAIHGFGLAARFYFAKPLNELSTAEIATLVGLVKGASYYNPRRHPERALQRRNLVLDLMAEAKVISHNERMLAQAQPLKVANAQRAGQREYPAFLELARAQLQQEYRLEDLQTEGLRIFTTLDPWAQHALEAATDHQLKRLEQRFPKQQGKLEAAGVITSVDGGEVRAMLGGREAEFFGFNRALNAQRAIGSLAKPMVYLAALESGQWHWGSRIDDSPVTVTGTGQTPWQPQNFDRKSHGQMPLVDALAMSYNQATARLGMQVGLGSVAATFKRLGLKAEVPPYPSIMLGAISLSPFEVAGLYQGIASQGFVMPLRSIKAVTDNQGQMLSAYSLQGQQEFSPVTMQWLTWGLEQVAERGTAKVLGQYLPLPLAAKTGTSNDQRDAWFMGFDNRHLGVVWVGRDDNEPMPLVGGSAALPIWQDSFRFIGVDPLPEFSSLGWVRVNNAGEMVGEECEGSRYPLPKAKMPAQLSPCQVSTPKERKSWFDWLF